MTKAKTGFILPAATLAGILASFVSYRMLARYAGGWLPPAAIWTISLLMLITALIYGCTGYFRNRNDEYGTRKMLTFFHAAIIYLLAFDLYSFGWQKIGHLQMVVPLGMLDLPFNSLDGETLTWAYFRRSYPFTVAIAIAQISGALLLLFRRTRLLGLIVIVPVLLNIILIDIFYHLHTWVLLHAILLMSCVIYLIYQYRYPLITFFFQTSRDVIKWNASGKTEWGRRLLIISLPVLLLATYRRPDRHPEFTGKYKVKDLRVNGTPQAANSAKDSILTTVYMDLQDDWVMEFNHYNSRYFGTYHYDNNSGRFHVKWRYPAGFNMKFDGMLVTSGDGYRFDGMLGSDTVGMELVPVPERR